ncbi:hypothetical protein [Tautonia sociabilis]|uniref:Uncharacterized protein n=1 Tax=Tautonia sociabilis TaxID=2080755 RepID=A0A432MH04_9BACT|nr:hypothetical protein [Tautonia sociabilis]RUL86208.1 hypothetical protein TsocGM_16745 [Tautonia sociabilis]
MPGNSDPDAREVDRVDALVTVSDPNRIDEFLARCVEGSAWAVHIRTADVEATVIRRHPLASLSERDCTCIRFKLALPVPVEPGLRFRVTDLDDPSLEAAAIVRPWGST